MSELNVAFLWHMHQPLYLDPLKEHFAMPWVRLHAVKAYTDMIACLDSRPEAKVTFNLVPSLILQVQSYLQGKTDDFLDLSRRPASELSPSDKEFILTHFFSCHWPTMIEPYQRYSQLLGLRGRKFNPSSDSLTIKEFSTQDYLDLQVWFNLTWVGFSSRGHPLISSLLQKGRMFSEREKLDLLDFHSELMRGLIPRYTSKWIDGQIEISTSPFYHPILPLLIDTDLGRRPRPETRLPPRFTHPEDARAQLEMGREFCRDVFGQGPVGLWPSEGSVAPELVPLVEGAGFSWAATDEAILYNSVGQRTEQTLFQPYRLEIDGSSIDMVFRHHELSDLIGFVYQKNDPQDAVSDFISRLNGISRGLQGMDRPPLVAVILDGENPWEYYRDSGWSFLTGLYDTIIREPGLRLVTIGQYLDEYPPTITLNHLDTGSWINKDFGIWIGGQEENRAWEALGHARKALDDAQKRGVAEEALKTARESVFAAEGSDWFWWYGDKFASDYIYGFDFLFRTHLKKVYKALNIPVPEELLVSIRRPRPVVPTDSPTSFIHPKIDGRMSYYWEWVGAGLFTLTNQDNTMYSGMALLSEVFYGFDLDRLYLRIDPRRRCFEDWDTDLVLKITVTSRKVVVAIELIPREHPDLSTGNIKTSRDGKFIAPQESGIECAVDEIVELAVPFVLLEAFSGDKLTFCIETVQSRLVRERWPQEGYIMFHVPDRDFERRLWLV